MRVAKAKRKLIRWHRYLRSTGSQSTNRSRGGYHAGHAVANWNYMVAHRSQSGGLRVPYSPLYWKPGI